MTGHRRSKSPLSSPAPSARPRVAPAQIGGALALALLAWLALDSVYDLRADQEALVVRLGRPVSALNTPGGADAGLKLKLPLVDQVIRFDRRDQGLEASPIEAITADGRPMIVDAFLYYRVLQPLQTYQATGDAQAASDRLGQMLNGAVRQAIGRASYASLMTGDRGALIRQARAAVGAQARAQGFGVDIVDVGLDHVDPTPPEAQALIHRMQTAQVAEAAAIRAAGEQRKEALMADADKDAGVIRAAAIGQSEAIWGQGDAGRADIFAKAYGKDPSFAHFYQAMRAYEGALADKQTTLILSPTSAFFQAFQKGPGGGQ